MNELMIKQENGIDKVYAIYAKDDEERKVCNAAKKAEAREAGDAALPVGVDGAGIAAGRDGAGGHGAPPVVPLGYEGEKVVLYSNKYHVAKSFLPEKLTRANLVSLAPLKDWERFIFSSDEEPGEREIIRKSQDWILDKCGGTRFDAASIRGRGVWPDKASGGVVYNSGQACFLVPPDGGLSRISPCRGGVVYSVDAALPEPAGEPLTDEEGARLIDFFSRRVWSMEGSGELLSGWAVNSLLAGVMPCCPHVWVNAPAGEGKSKLKSDLADFFGGLAVSFDSAETTAPAIRQRLNGSCLPVLLDEAEAGDSESGARNLGKVLELMRLAFNGGMLGKGTADGVGKGYRMKCGFALFSIANSLNRDSDQQRTLVLRLRKGKDKEALSALWEGQKAGRALVQGDGFHGRLLARLLPMAGVIRGNVKTLEKHLAGCGADARRACLFAVLMAGAHALAHSGNVDDAYLEHAAKIMEAYGGQEEAEDDFSRCLTALLYYRLSPIPGLNTLTVQLACRKICEQTVETESLAAIENALGVAGMKWDDKRKALRVDTRTGLLKEIYKRTQWQSGRGIVPVLMEGCKDFSEDSRISKGSFKAGGKTPYNCIYVPKSLIWGEES